MEQTSSASDSAQPESRERRCGPDRRRDGDRRKVIRFENCRRRNYGRRQEDKDLWKEALTSDQT